MLLNWLKENWVLTLYYFTLAGLLCYLIVSFNILLGLISDLVRINKEYIIIQKNLTGMLKKENDKAWRGAINANSK